MALYGHVEVEEDASFVVENRSLINIVVEILQDVVIGLSIEKQVLEEPMSVAEFLRFAIFLRILRNLDFVEFTFVLLVPVPSLFPFQLLTAVKDTRLSFTTLFRFWYLLQGLSILLQMNVIGGS